MATLQPRPLARQALRDCAILYKLKEGERRASLDGISSRQRSDSAHVPTRARAGRLRTRLYTAAKLSIGKQVNKQVIGGENQILPFKSLRAAAAGTSANSDVIRR